MPELLNRRRHDTIGHPLSIIDGIFVSTDEPSAPELGDVWFDYTVTPPSFVAAGALTETTSTSAQAVVLPAGWAENDLFLLVAEFNAAPTVTLSAGWTLRATRRHTQNDRTLSVYSRVAVAGDTDPTVTSNNANGWIGAVSAFRGVDPDDPFAVASASVGDSAVGTFANFQPGSVTTDDDNALILSIIGTDDDNALALVVGSENGFTAVMGGAAYDSTVPTVDESIGIATKTGPAAGVFTAPTWDLPVNGPDRFVYITDALKRGPKWETVTATYVYV